MIPMKHRRGDRTSDGTSDEISTFDDVSKNRTNFGKLSRVGGAFCFVALYLILTSSDGRTTADDVMAKPSTGTKTNKATKASSDPMMADYPDFSKAFAKYENCTVSYVPPPAKSEWTTKPLWLSAYPGSGTTSPTGKGDILKPLINGITGLKAGAKFYHASSKILKRCKGKDETATCSQGHPVVPIGPEGQVNNFYHSIIMVIRNFKTAYPTYQNDKAEAYHGAKGQVSEEEWRQHRDEWYKVAFDAWKNLIMTWKEMKEYDIGLYVQYEALMDPERGPTTSQRIADILQKAGFSVAPKEDIPCLWFRAVKGEYLRRKDFLKYTPGYTKEEQDTILQELNKFQTEVSNDNDLLAILKEYYNDIRDNLKIDIPTQKSAEGAKT